MSYREARNILGAKHHDDHNGGRMAVRKAPLDLVRLEKDNDSVGQDRRNSWLFSAGGSGLSWGGIGAVCVECAECFGAAQGAFVRSFAEARRAR